MVKVGDQVCRQTTMTTDQIAYRGELTATQNLLFSFHGPGAHSHALAMLRFCETLALFPLELSQQ